jgi:hypothetical protein
MRTRKNPTACLVVIVMDNFFFSAAVLILSLNDGRSISFPMLGLPDDSCVVAVNGSALIRFTDGDASAHRTSLNTNANFIRNYGCPDRTREQCSKQVPAHPILLQLSVPSEKVGRQQLVPKRFGVISSGTSSEPMMRIDTSITATMFPLVIMPFC